VKGTKHAGVMGFRGSFIWPGETKGVLDESHLRRVFKGSPAARCQAARADRLLCVGRWGWVDGRDRTWK
jgi:hypothetical protein